MPKKSTAAAEPALIVFGYNQPIGSAQASWFRAAHAKRADATAQRLGFATMAVDSDERRAGAAQLSEGQLLSRGKLLLPAITDELHQQLQEVLVKRASATEASTSANDEPDTTVKTGEPLVEPIETESPPETAPPTPVTVAAWNALIPGARVLAIYLDKRGNSDGWWEAEIVHIREGGVFFLTWCDEPETGVVMRQRDQIALMLPTT